MKTLKISNNIKGSLMLLVSAIIWGSAFVAQEESVASIGSFALNCLRSFVGALVLIPVLFAFKVKREKETGKKEKIFSKTLIIGGVCCGAALSLAANLQQFGIIFNASLSEGSSGKAGFITAMYIVFVPLFMPIFSKKAPKISIILAVLIAVAGLYFISIKEGFSISSGDIVLILCAVAFSVHIMVVSIFVSKVDGVALSCVQFFTVGVISGIFMLIFERDNISVSNTLAAAVPILYCGVMSSGVAYTLQILSQKLCEPSIASLVMSLESVFAMVTASVYYRILPTSREFIGCILMMVAIFIVETPYVDNLLGRIFKKGKQKNAV